MEHVTGNESLTPEEFSALQEAKRMVSTRNNWTLEQHKWVDHACLVRFLRAKHLDVDAAMKMLDNTLQWRKSYLASITWPSVSQSASSSIITIMEDPSCCGRTVVLVNPLQANSMTDEQQALQHDEASSRLHYSMMHTYPMSSIMPVMPHVWCSCVSFYGPWKWP